MPLYEYRCRECAERFEVLQRLGAGADELSCPRCDGEVERQHSTFAAHGASASSFAGDFAGCAPGGIGGCAPGGIGGCGGPSCGPGSCAN